MNGERRLATGQQEARLLTELERTGRPVLALPRPNTLLPDLSTRQFHDLLHRLARKGWLLPIERGKYLVVPRAARGMWHEHPFVVAAGLAPGASYISYWSALSYHHLTEQLPRAVYVAMLGKRKRAVRFQGWLYRFVTVDAEKFYGFGPHEFTALNGAATVEVDVAAPEKAVLDSLDEEPLAGGMSEIVKALQRGLERRSLSPDRLADYTRRYPNAAVAARLGFLLDRLGVPEAAELRPVARRLKHPVYLSLLAPREAAPLDATWHVRANVPDDVFAPLDVA